jgi:hypothetical protein
LISPAIALADEGFVLQPGDVRLLAEGTKELRNDPPSAAIFLDAGDTRAVGSRLVQKDLAATLREVSRVGAEGFYRGRVAENDRGIEPRGAAASSRWRISRATSRGRWRRSSATTAVTGSSRRRRRARAGWSCARC